MADLAEILERLTPHLVHLAVWPHLRPGTDDLAIRRTERAFGHGFPEALRELYRWRNGAPNPSGFHPTWTLVPGRMFVGLEDGLALARQLRESSPWPEDCFPILTDGWDGSEVGVRCPRGEVIEQLNLLEPAVVAPSLGAWLGQISQLFEQGGIEVDPQGIPNGRGLAEAAIRNGGDAAALVSSTEHWCAVLAARFGVPFGFVQDWLGDALQDLGSLDAAKEDVERACDFKTRVSGWREAVWRDWGGSRKE